MQPVFFVIAILGCGDGTSQCTATGAEQARYATMAECRADQAAALARHTDLSFPVITATCLATGPLAIAKSGKAAPRG